jgi:DNA-binding transcriptional regulator YdaS (Cro superfamily)
MKLAEYLKLNHISQPKFAKRLKVNESAVGHWIYGVREPRPDMARKIVKATGGAVTLQDIYG